METKELFEGILTTVKAAIPAGCKTADDIRGIVEWKIHTPIYMTTRMDEGLL